MRYMAIKYAKRMDLFKKSELGEILKLIEQPDIISFAAGALVGVIIGLWPFG